MDEVHVNVYIHAPVARVFEIVSDHESFMRAEDGTRTKLVRPGTAERNGLGALREVQVRSGIRGLEEITAFERPSSFAYRLRETTLPIRHHGGLLRFIPRGEGTQVDWSSRFEVTLPLVARPVEILTRQITKVAFSEMLFVAKARLEAEPR
ncbi:SRPBCC family protein [Chondromyces apiculatus]|uniref:SRPBCC family protein n=1 Tax=Chondromyces apiculatus DSM 436 TaxID=1192034 RepID=A0A017T3T4_9BACT|nr:SRPBCC family protein [Chondromyces apiculatus]EYF03485.1 Hypothetical protein CAP_5469 [Chondromyces apiculatus DSM 436]